MDDFLGGPGRGGGSEGSGGEYSRVELIWTLDFVFEGIEKNLKESSAGIGRGGRGGAGRQAQPLRFDVD